MELIWEPAGEYESIHQYIRDLESHFVHEPFPPPSNKSKASWEWSDPFHRRIWNEHQKLKHPATFFGVPEPENLFLTNSPAINKELLRGRDGPLQYYGEELLARQNPSYLSAYVEQLAKERKYNLDKILRYHNNSGNGFWETVVPLNVRTHKELLQVAGHVEGSWEQYEEDKTPKETKGMSAEQRTTMYAKTKAMNAPAPKKLCLEYKIQHCSLVLKALEKLWEEQGTGLERQVGIRGMVQDAETATLFGIQLAEWELKDLYKRKLCCLKGIATSPIEAEAGASLPANNPMQTITPPRSETSDCEASSASRPSTLFTSPSWREGPFEESYERMRITEEDKNEFSHLCGAWERPKESVRAEKDLLELPPDTSLSADRRFEEKKKAQEKRRQEKLQARREAALAEGISPPARTPTPPRRSEAGQITRLKKQKAKVEAKKYAKAAPKGAKTSPPPRQQPAPDLGGAPSGFFKIVGRGTLTAPPNATLIAAPPVYSAPTAATTPHQRAELSNQRKPASGAMRDQKTQNAIKRASLIRQTGHLAEKPCNRCKKQNIECWELKDGKGKACNNCTLAKACCKWPEEKTEIEIGTNATTTQGKTGAQNSSQMQNGVVIAGMEALRVSVPKEKTEYEAQAPLKRASFRVEHNLVE